MREVACSKYSYLIAEAQRPVEMCDIFFVYSSTLAAVCPHHQHPNYSL
jgi:hypothetical protein